MSPVSIPISPSIGAAFFAPSVFIFFWSTCSSSIFICACVSPQVLVVSLKVLPCWLRLLVPSPEDVLPCFGNLLMDFFWIDCPCLGVFFLSRCRVSSAARHSSGVCFHSLSSQRTVTILLGTILGVSPHRASTCPVCVDDASGPSARSSVCELSSGLLFLPHNSFWLHNSLSVGNSVIPFYLTLFHRSSPSSQGSTPKSTHSIFFHTYLIDLI